MTSLLSASSLASPKQFAASVQAMDRREEAVQEVEEARLALRAAQRDNVDLQARLQQHALQQRPGHSHSRPATARQLWAAPRDRPFTSASVSPHSKYVPRTIIVINKHLGTDASLQRVALTHDAFVASGFHLGSALFYGGWR